MGLGLRPPCRCTVFLYAAVLALAATAHAQDNTKTTTSATFPTLSNTDTTSDTATTSASSSATDPTSTTSTTDSTPTTTAALPSLTTSTSSTTPTDPSTTTYPGGLTNAPTLSGYAIPSLIVPDTSKAPFMQKSNLPEGTVFICVGAALGFLGMCVLAWRAWVAWSLQRSVAHAGSSYRQPPDTKSPFAFRSGGPLGGGRPGGGARHPYTDGSNMSLEHLTSTNTAYQGAGHKAKERPSHRRDRDRKGAPSRTPTSSALFFSPTAGAVGGTAPSHQPSNRASSYLPAGYYASGAVAPAAGAAIAHIGGPTAAGYGRIESAANTPPDTPRARPSPARRASSGRELLDLRDGRGGGAGAGAFNELDISGLEQRTPSAVLDSWFEHSTAMGRADRL